MIFPVEMTSNRRDVSDERAHIQVHEQRTCENPEEAYAISVKQCDKTTPRPFETCDTGI